MQTASGWDDLSDIIKKTGLDVIDNDHRVLTEFIIEFNKLLDIVNSEGFNLHYINQQKELFEKLHDYSAQHFRREEKLINRFSLVGGEYQNEQHQYFLGMIRSYIKDFSSGKLNVSLHLKLTILNWWINHINTIDYRTFCMQNWAPKVLQVANNWNDVRFLIRSIGIDSIDEQHQTMTELALKINQSVQKDAESFDIQIFEELYDYAKLHFDHEEGLIRHHNLGGKEKQLERHEYFLTLLKSYKERLLENKLEVNDELRHSIMEWWINHINQEDYLTFCSTPWIEEAIHEAADWDSISHLVRKTGITGIDEQHKKQSKLILELHGFIDQLESKNNDSKFMKKFTDKLHQIFQYASDHFRYEENLMEKSNLIDSGQHKQEHQDLLEKIQTHIEHAIAGRIILSERLKDTLLHWWVQHINDTDHKTFVVTPDSELQAL